MTAIQTYAQTSFTAQDLVTGYGTIDINYQPAIHRTGEPLASTSSGSGLTPSQLSELNNATTLNQTQATEIANKMNKTSGTVTGDKVLISSGTTGLETVESTVTQTLLEGFDARITTANQASNYTINRTNSDADVLPTALEVPTPKDGTTATVILSNNLIEFYTYTSGVWVLKKALPPVTLDGNNTVVVRSNNTTGVAPTAIEKPTPINGDTADVYLLDGIREVYAHNGTAWALIKTILPTALDGSDKHIVRANTVVNIAPTNLEVPNPINGLTAKVILSNGSVEYWSHNGTTWIRDYIKVSDVNIITPTTYADLTAQTTATTNGKINQN